MNTLLTENLREKLKRRVSRFDTSDEVDTFYIKIVQFWNFFNQHPTLLGIAEDLLPNFPNITQDVDKAFKGQSVTQESDEQAAALGYKVIQRLASTGKDALHQLSFASAAALHRVSPTQGLYEYYVEPLCNYVDEQLHDQSIMLSLLIRYKQRSEWFYREQLFEISQLANGSDKRHEIEKRLARDLYGYLHDQGIDFHIEPSSMPGKIDLIAAQNTDDPLLLEVKVFDNDGRDKSYLCNGFNQIYIYTLQYNEPFGYMVIFNISDRDLRFALKCTGHIPLVLHNNKTIFVLTIAIRPLIPPSQRGTLNPIEILEDELIRK